jgi:hypothetical protein
MGVTAPAFTHAYLQRIGNGPLRREEQLLQSECARRGLPVTFYTLKQIRLKQIRRRALPLSHTTFIAGDMDAMHGAMGQLRIEVPPPNDYPESLTEFLHRRVWQTTLAGAEHAVAEHGPLFVKPAERRKSFTGRICAAPQDFWSLGNTSRRQNVWCAEVVHWQAEFRVYVIQDSIVAIDRYAGDTTVELDLEVVESALAAYRASGTAPSAYGIDFGVLASGATALVEANDGYALGAYAIAAEPYMDLLLRRWSELLMIGSRE